MRPVADTPVLASQHPELVAQHEDLNLLALARAAEQDEQLGEPARHQEQQREHVSPPVDGNGRIKLVRGLIAAASARPSLTRRLRAGVVYAPYGVPVAWYPRTAVSRRDRPGRLTAGRVCLSQRLAAD